MARAFGGSTRAVRQGGDWQRTVAKARRIWMVPRFIARAANWSGVCANGFAQGAGNLQGVHDGKPYEKDEGEWNAGQQSGRGTQVCSSGRYDGELVNGEPHGRGVLTLLSARYEGEFRGIVAQTPQGALRSLGRLGWLICQPAESKRNKALSPLIWAVSRVVS